MLINISDDVIEQMVKEQVNTSVRQRIKEMQGDYTSKGFIENIIKDIIWNKISELCPDVEDYIKSEVERCVNSAFSRQNDLKLTKKQLVEQVVENLLEKF